MIRAKDHLIAFGVGEVPDSVAMAGADAEFGSVVE
jgi:hypothetical protein